MSASQNLRYPVTLMIYDDVLNQIIAKVTWVTASEYSDLLDRCDADNAFAVPTTTRAPRRLRKWILRIAEAIGLTITELGHMIPPVKSEPT